MSKTPINVLIIGNGIAGPVLAMALQKTTKHKVVLVDAGPEESAPIGAGIGIAPNGSAALKFIDADHILRELGGVSERTILRRGDRDTILVEQPTTGPYTEKWGAPNHGIIRQRLVASLRELAKKRGIEMLFQTRLEHLEEVDDVVTARFVDGKTLTADLVVCCDGIHSVGRGYVVGEVIEPRYAGISAIQGVATLSLEDQEKADLKHGLNFLIGHSTLFGVYPAGPENTWSWFFGLKSADAKGSEAGWSKTRLNMEQCLTIVKESTSDWKSSIPSIVLSNTYRSYSVGIYDREPIDVWHKGRVVLCGDAAHPTTPMGGQGSQMAIESAVILARLLGEEEPSEELFKKYTALRKPRTSKVTGGARRGVAAVFGLEGMFDFALEYARDWFLWAVGGYFFRSGMNGLFAYNAITVPLTC